MLEAGKRIWTDGEEVNPSKQFPENRAGSRDVSGYFA
jgi:hypothetical protein